MRKSAALESSNDDNDNNSAADAADDYECDDYGNDADYNCDEQTTAKLTKLQTTEVEISFYC